MRITHKLLISLFALLVSFSASAAQPSNPQEARSMFNRTWGMITSPRGFSLSYSVNIIGLYKTAGTIWAQGKKQHYVEKRYLGWNNGSRVYKVDLKKRTVELHNARSAKRDKYLSKFTFNPNDYNYSWTNSKKGIVIHLNAKRGAKSSIKHAKVILNKRTRYPIALKVKVAFFWTKVAIYNFHPGISNANIFNYPANRYRNFKFKNCWPE